MQDNHPQTGEQRQGAAWIISRNQDTLLFLAPNLVGALVVLWGATVFWEQKIFYYCNIFFTLAHFGPTWIRCYLDKEEFRAHRSQLIFFPIFFFALSLLTSQSMVILLFILYFWDRFHGIMQNVGFLKMYDSKAGMTTPVWNHLDRAYLFALSGVVMAFNMGHFTAMITSFSSLGIPITITSSDIFVLREITVAIALGATAVYAWDLREQYRTHGRFNISKLLFLASLTAGHFAMNLSTSILLLITHEKIYHSIQYMVLVWRYNNNKITRYKQEETGKLFRFFSKSRIAYLMYILGWIAFFMGLEQVIGKDGDLFARVNIGIALCHYYFDAFLWRVRGKNVRKNL